MRARQVEIEETEQLHREWMAEMRLRRNEEKDLLKEESNKELELLHR